MNAPIDPFHLPSCPMVAATGAVIIGTLAVVLPLIAPALAAAWLLSFSLSLDDFVITAFVTGPGATTLPLFVFSSVKLGMSPEINALGTIIVAVASLVALGATILQRRRA